MRAEIDRKAHRVDDAAVGADARRERPHRLRGLHGAKLVARIGPRGHVARPGGSQREQLLVTGRIAERRREQLGFRAGQRSAGRALRHVGEIARGQPDDDDDTPHDCMMAPIAWIDHGIVGRLAATTRAHAQG